MTSTISGADFKPIIHDTTLTDTESENILNNAISLIILYGTDISINKLAAGGSLSVSDKKQAAIYLAARAIYSSYYRNAANEPTNTVGFVSHSSTDLMSNPTVLAAIKEAAQLLRERDWSKSII